MPTHPAASGVSVGAKAATSQTSTPPHAPLAKASIHSRDCGSSGFAASFRNWRAFIPGHATK